MKNPILIDLPMPIETPRLLLRPPRVGEGRLLNEAILESFETLNKFMLWATEKPSLETSEEVVRKAVANWILKKNEDPDLMLFIFDKSTNQFVGATGYHQMDWEKPSVETGYWVRSQFAGKGFITEAINGLTQYAFKQIGVKKITITCDVDNIRSKKIPEKLRFKLESTLKSHRKKPITGEASDTLVYVRTNLDHLPELNVTWDSKSKTNKIQIRDLDKRDFDALNQLFGVNTQYKNTVEKWENYLNLHQLGERIVKIVEVDNRVIGISTLKIKSDYLPFKMNNIPEINDLLIYSDYQKNGYGSALIGSLENEARKLGYIKIGIGVGLYKDYGKAQRLYVKLGYIPDGEGISYQNQNVIPGNQYAVDDDLILYFTKLL